jgi:RNA-directed DNA polymerase
VKDRIVQAALKMVVEPIFEVQFREGSYGFRPGRGCKDALREVDRLLKEGYTHVVDADLKGYFDTIPHDRLMALVEGSISDGRVLSLIESFLHQDIMTETARWHPEAGTPQGAVLSPLLANLYLHPLDLLMEQSGYRMVRYADDFVILCASEAEAQAALRQVSVWVDANGLTLYQSALTLTLRATTKSRVINAVDMWRRVNVTAGWYYTRTRRRSVTATNRARGSTSWATGSRLACASSARRV